MATCLDVIFGTTRVRDRQRPGHLGITGEDKPKCFW
ncbi:hypothetical protein J2128_000204 [Methanomicrobium sp. W14]|nr:hypothetical protein [Methanomicrobium sp. W14]